MLTGKAAGMFQVEALYFTDAFALDGAKLTHVQTAVGRISTRLLKPD
jgi:hypothetical protein